MRERRRSPDRTGDDPVSPDTPPGGPEVPPGEDPEAKVRNLVLRMLTHSPRTRAQLERSLYRREYEEELVTRVLDRIEEAGLIDDAAFAKGWVSSRHHSRHLSRRALSQELRTRGIEEETVREAVAEVSDEDETEAARALARKRLAGSRGKDDETRIRRALGALARKGYPAGLSYRIVREELEVEGEDTDLAPDTDLL
ncbi:regulatory protein RecX [Nocardiopsis sp. MG754419]|uniref:regulatory protein RecX n=1 Tax=Nocardiopsis sp. MG754419 TaxID=2259865 RepID=UPI001BA956F2|nr:regulatory protein RecX [Nocardiopsis sp. MG754419]MBR8743479.1 recombination regulator RecX [Nocardiopsis sp. MG754419]